MDVIIPKIKSISNISKKKEIEILKNELPTKTKKNMGNGGARDNAGRPKGSKNQKTVEEETAREYFRKRVINSVSKLIDSQMNLARGVQYLFKIEVIWKTGKDGKKFAEKQKPVIVKDKEEIASYLNGEFDDKDDNDYYFLTTEKPDNKALDSLLDRVFGKAKQSIEHSGSIDLEGILEERRNLKK